MGQVVISELADELENDPLGFGYSSMNDAEVEVSLDTIRRDSVVIVSVVTPEIAQAAVDFDEFAALTLAQQNGWLALVGLPTFPVVDVGIQGQVDKIWTAAGSPITSVRQVGLRTREGTRNEELFGEGARATHTDVAQARGRN